MDQLKRLDRPAFFALKRNLELAKKLEVRIITGSMTPLIPMGTVKSIEWVRPQDLRIGDIVVFYSSEILICHYVHRQQNVINSPEASVIFVRGICDKMTLQPVSVELVLGRVIGIRVGLWSLFLGKLHYIFQSCFHR